jgi:hypothetical protein
MTLPAQPETETTAAAEGRPVTVLFADVVDSTSLAERVDPEDWSGAIRSVLTLMSAPVRRYGGTVASLMGDGLLAVFGAPAAHEDDAIRAVHAGLEMIDAVSEAGQVRGHAALAFTAISPHGSTLVRAARVLVDALGHLDSPGDCSTPSRSHRSGHRLRLSWPCTSATADGASKHRSRTRLLYRTIVHGSACLLPRGVAGGRGPLRDTCLLKRSPVDTCSGANGETDPGA